MNNIAPEDIIRMFTRQDEIRSDQTRSAGEGNLFMTQGSISKQFK